MHLATRKFPVENVCIRLNGGLPSYSQHSCTGHGFRRSFSSLIRFPAEKGVREAGEERTHRGLGLCVWYALLAGGRTLFCLKNKHHARLDVSRELMQADSDRPAFQISPFSLSSVLSQSPLWRFIGVRGFEVSGFFLMGRRAAHYHNGENEQRNLLQVFVAD